MCGVDRFDNKNVLLYTEFLFYGTPIMNTHDKLNPSKSEQLSLLLLAKILKHVTESKPNASAKEESNELAKLLIESIEGGHYWAIEDKVGHLLGDSIDEEINAFVLNVLDMWDFIESSYEDLSNEDKQKLEEAVPYVGKNPKFIGFDGNNESVYRSVCLHHIEKLNHFERFKKRGTLNSHSQKVPLYAKMLDAFEDIRSNLDDRLLNLEEMIQILK